MSHGSTGVNWENGPYFLNYEHYTNLFTDVYTESGHLWSS